MADLLIKNGIVINASSKYRADVLIKQNKIARVEQGIHASENTEVIDASNKYVIPGGIDPHVHFHLPTPAGYSSDNFFTGSKAAIAGGTTSVVDFVTPQRGESLIKALDKRKKEAENCLCHYGFHMTPLHFNDQVNKEMQQCVIDEGVTSFKTYMAYKNTIGINDQTLAQVLNHTGYMGALTTVHAEDDALINSLQQHFIAQGKTSPKYHALSRLAKTEYLAAKRVIELAKKSKSSLYLVHVSTKQTAKAIAEAQKAGFNIVGETCPQYLLLNEKLLYHNFYTSAPYVCSPALRSSEHHDALWKALRLGNIQTLGTDHCPFLLYGQKDQGKNNFTKIPNGIGGVEHRLALMFTYGVLNQNISLEKWVDLASFQPAKWFGIKNKGEIKTGFDADVVIWNPEIEKIISYKNQWQNCDVNVYEGMKTYGEAEKVIINGKVVFQDQEFMHQECGTFIWRELPNI